ncbi:TetR/AcrR family transcriptional regulator [Agrococcus casei]
MQRRGPRGDIDEARILRAADALLAERGDIDGISLRSIAAEVGVAVNALYTYFPSLRAIWHDLADERLGLLRPTELLDIGCSHCAVLELVDRAGAMAAVPGTLSLLRAQPVLGRNSFALSETIMTLTEHGSISPRNAHDLIVGWFYGSSVLDSEGWTSGTDEIRASEPLPEFPRIADRDAADRHEQAEAILRGIGLSCQRL